MDAGDEDANLPRENEYQAKPLKTTYPNVQFDLQLIGSRH
jgi:hypothetical protein